MKKIIAILLSILLLFLTACSGNTTQSQPVETTAAQILEADAVPAAPEAPEAAVEAVEEVVEVVEVTIAADHYTESMDDVHFGAPNSWTKTDYSNDSLKEYIYYMDDTKQNSVMAMMLYAGNTIYTRDQAEQYMDMFMEGFFNQQNGYGDGTYEVHAASNPARHGYYTSSGLDVEVYCFLPTTTSIFILSKWNLPENSSEIADEEFLKMVNSVQLPELDVTEETPSNSGKQNTTNFSNKYGTASTKCAYSGCSRNIASSGDTNCCATHSNKCGNCGCYIDSDAMFCMSCLEDSLGGSKDSYDYDKGYGYTAPKKGQSFSDYVKEQDPDLYDSITNNYNSAVGSKSDSYDYDKGYGYTAPKKGQSFSDYVKEQDPDLYNSLFK